MRSSFQELFSRIMNTGPNGYLCSKKGIESFETHSCDSDGHISGIFKMISTPSPNSNRKKNELEVRRPSDEENLCPPEYTNQTSNKKQSKLKNSVPNESGKTKRMKLTEEELPQKEHRKKRDKMTNGEKIPSEHTKLSSPTTHRRSESLDGNSLHKNRDGNKRHNGEVTRTHSHSINNTQTSQHVLHTHVPRSHLTSCPTLKPTPIPSPDLPPKHPSHFSKLNPNHRHRQNGIVSNREPSPLTNGDITADDITTQVSEEVSIVGIESESTPHTVDIRRAVLAIKKRSIEITPLIEKIYSENKKRVESVTSRDILSNSTMMYRQPCEFPRYYDNIYSYKQKRPQVIKLLQNRLVTQYKKEYLLCCEQDLIQEKWESSMQETIDSEKTVHNKIREQCDRYCPELKRQREQERAAKAFGECELTEENSLERHESVAAVIPAMLTDRRETQIKFSSRNGYIEDITKFTNNLKCTNIWTEEEKSIFKDKFYQCPKNFEFIASCLRNKSVSECIEYYYLNKKHVNFKQAVRGSNMKRRKNRLQPKDLYLYVKPRGTSITSPDQPAAMRQRRTAEVNWSPDEVEKLRTALLLHGRSWNKIQQAVGRPNFQCKMFYNDFASIEEYGLQQAIDERLRRKRLERMVTDTEDPLPAIKLHEDISDVDSPSRQVLSSPCTTLTPDETTSHPLTDHSYTTQLASRAPTFPPVPTPDTDPTRLTPLPPGVMSRLMKTLMDTYNCRHGSVRLRKPRGSSASALLQPSNHRRLSSTPTRGSHKRAPLVSSVKTHVSQERPSSDTSLETAQREYPSVLTPPETKSPLVSSEVVAETDTQDRTDKPEQRNSSDYDSDQEGGRLVIDIGADELIEGPSEQRGSFMSLPDLERTEDQEVFQSDDTSPSELSPDSLTDLSPPQPMHSRFQDAWAYRVPCGAFDWSVPETCGIQFDSYLDRDPVSLGSEEKCCLEDKLDRISLGDRPTREICTWNPFSLMDTEKTQRNVDVPIPAKHNLPIEIQQSLDSLEHQPSLPHQLYWNDQNKRNGHSTPTKESTHKRFKSELCPISNGTHLKEEPTEEIRVPDKNALQLQYLAQCRPDLYPQHLLPYPMYHHLAPLLLQNPYLHPSALQQQGKLIFPSGIPFPISKQPEQILVQNPMTSSMPSLLLQRPSIYPLRYPSLPEAPVMPHESIRGHKSST